MEKSFGHAFVGIGHPEVFAYHGDFRAVLGRDHAAD